MGELGEFTDSDENDVIEDLNLTDLIDVETLQRLQDSFSRMTGIASLTADVNGVAVTKGSKFSDFCTNYTRVSETGRLRCEKCDKYGAELALREGKSITYYCHAGLVDFAAPIMAHDKMVGCFIGGQVLPTPPDKEKVYKVAKEIGVDPEAYWEAACKVNVIEKENIDGAAEFLYTIAAVLSDIAYNRYIVHKANKAIERAAGLKSDFLANMSHEIRTPMNAVIGMAEMALREELPDTARNYITQIKSSGKALLTIINDILDFSKIESGKMDIVITEYEPMSLFNDISNIIMTRMEDKDFEFVMDIAPDIPHCLLGDSIRLKQIILNLVNNAVKFTKEGQVLFRARFEWLNEKEICLLLDVEDTGIGIKEQDIGKLFQSFQQVDSKRNRNVEGTGLGLAITKQLLQLMDGDISVESEYEKGSIFSASLPQEVIDPKPSLSVLHPEQKIVVSDIQNAYIDEQLQRDCKQLQIAYYRLEKDIFLRDLENEPREVFYFVEESRFTFELEQFVKENPQITVGMLVKYRASSYSQMSNVVKLQKPFCSLTLYQVLNHEQFYQRLGEAEEFEFVAPEASILVVDDNAINLTIAEGLLQPLQLQIDTALSGKKALEMIAQKQYDLIFMDHMMPELDGVETTGMIRRFHPKYKDVPIIALTANAVDGAKELFLQAGMNDFVAKPIELRILVSKVKQWLPKKKLQRIGNSAGKQETNPRKAIPMIGDLDVEHAVQLLGSEELFWKVLKDYYHAIDKKAEKISNAFAQEQWREFTIEVHALKSASRQIGANSLGEKAAKLEEAGNAQDVAYIRQYTESLLEDYMNYKSVLEPFMEQERNMEAKPMARTETLMDCFGQMREALDNLDMDCMERVLEQMKEYQYPASQQTFMEELEEAVQGVDVEACEDILVRWQNADV